MKKEIDEELPEISSENDMFQKQIETLKEATVKLQNEIEELEQ